MGGGLVSNNVSWSCWNKRTLWYSLSLWSDLWLGERWALEDNPTPTTYSETVLEQPWESRCGLIFLQWNLEIGWCVRGDDEDFFYILEPLQKRKTMCLDQINDPPSLASVQEQILTEEGKHAVLRQFSQPPILPIDNGVSKRRVISLYLLSLNDFSSRNLSRHFFKQCKLLTGTSAARNFPAQLPCLWKTASFWFLNCHLRVWLC